MGRGLVGSVLFAGAVQSGSWGSVVESECSSVGSDCAASTAVGGGLLLSIGYMWRHFGFDVFGAATGDGGSRSFLSRTGAGQSVSMGRLGGLLAVRARATYDAGPLRGTLALGPGLAYRVLTGTNNFTSLAGMATTTLPNVAGSAALANEAASSQRPDLPFVQGYHALAFTGDASLEWRANPSTSLAVGLVVWIEKPTAPVAIDGGDMGGSVVLASGVETTLMPYFGLHFGP
jgi:hypothetical protein